MTDQHQGLNQSTVGHDVTQIGTQINYGSTLYPAGIPRMSMPLPPQRELFGREELLSKIILALKAGQWRIVQLRGKSGVGKTALVSAAVNALNCSYLRLEIQKESAEGVLAALYEIIVGQTAPPASTEQLRSQIVATWQKRRCLLIIENLHVLLKASDNPEHVDPQEGAIELLQALGDAGPQLLVTGWPSTDSIGTNATQIRTIQVPGVDPKDGAEILKSAGVRVPPVKISLQQISQNLNGNPGLLLRLAARVSGEPYNGDATFLDDDGNQDWIRDGASLMKKMWTTLGPDLQEILTAACILRRGQTCQHIAALVNRNKHETQVALESLSRWGHVAYVREDKTFPPDHDLTRLMVREHFGEEKLLELHRRAADLWLEEGENIGKEKTPTTIEEIQPLLEAGYHLAHAKDGKRLLWDVIARQCGDLEFHELADRLGAWAELTMLLEQLVKFEMKPLWLAQTHHGLGIRFQARGDWDAALTAYKAGLKIREQLGDLKGISWSRHQIGTVYQDKGDWDAALIEYRASLEIKEQLGDRAGVSKSRHQIGNVYYLKGDWDAALMEYRASLEILEQLGDRAGMSTSRHQIGMVYQDKGDWDAALVEYRASLEIAEQLGDRAGVAASLGQIGRVFQLQKRFVDAFDHSFLAFLAFVQLGAKHEIGIGLEHLAALRRDWGADNFDRAWKEKTGEDVPEAITKAAG